MSPLTRFPIRALAPILLAVLALGALGPVACGLGTQSARAQVRAGGSSSSSTSNGAGGSSLQDVADKAGRTARSVAIKVIGLALALAAIVLVFKRDFKEAAAIFAVGIIALLLASQEGVDLLQNTAHSLFG